MIVCGAEPHRVFVNLGTPACPLGCLYCYVPQGQPQPFPWSQVSAALQGLLGRPGFRTGPSGTIVTFSPHTDLFLQESLVSLFLKSVELLREWKNPIQVSTKQYIPPSLARTIRQTVDCDYRVTLMLSCATLQGASRFEPFAPAPVRRWRTFRSLAEAGLARCLLVKPWLGRSTERDLSAFAEVVMAYDVQAVCLGGLFLTERIRKRLGFTPEGAQSRRARHPLMEEDNYLIAPTQEIVLRLAQKIAPVPVFRSSVCAVAYTNGISCPRHGGDCAVP